MDTVLTFLKAHWQAALIGFGVLILIGAIFNINFIIDRQGERSFGFLSLFGNKGYRIILGIIGAGMVAYGVVALI